MIWRRKVRCVDCGFLATGLVELRRKSWGFSNFSEEPATALVRQRVQPFHMVATDVVTAHMAFICHLRVADLPMHVYDVKEPEHWQDMIRTPRRCPYFERYQPMLSFREHLDLKFRRCERWWAGGGVAGGIVLTATAEIIVRLVTS